MSRIRPTEPQRETILLQKYPRCQRGLPGCTVVATKVIRIREEEHVKDFTVCERCSE